MYLLPSSSSRSPIQLPTISTGTRSLSDRFNALEVSTSRRTIIPTNSLTARTTTGPASHRAPAPARPPARESPVRKPIRTRPVRLTKRDSPTDETWLVDSPRKIQFEKTILGAPNILADALEMYHAHIVIPDDLMESARARCDELLDYIVPRISKLANPIGMKILGRVYAGSTFNDTQVFQPNELDVFLTFENHKTKMQSVQAGYMTMPLKRHRAKKGSPPDKLRFGRSDNELYISSLKVADQMWQLIDRALKIHPSAKIQPFVTEDGKAQIQVKLNELTVNLIPACYFDKEDLYLITRPYTNDIDPMADELWRISYYNNERRILARMGTADRGARRRAFLCLKALVQQEHTLNGLTSYHIKSVLMHGFDDAVDSTPRWQRNTIDNCFLEMLQDLSMFLDAGVLPSFFVRSHNLFENMTPRLLATLRTRVGYLAQNHGEVLRVLRKHTH